MDDETQATGNVAPAQDATAQAPADTATTQPSEADVQETKNTPEATQEQSTAQETVAPETKAEDTVEEKLYAGKYKSVEDMENAYKELQSKATRDSQEKAELSRILNEAFASPEPQPQQAPTQEYEDDTQEVNPLASEVETLKRNQAVSSFIFSHPDAVGNAGEMQKILAEDPMVKQINGHEAKLEYAYLKSQNMSSKKAIVEAEKKSAQQAQAKVVEKQAAQVESASKTEPTDERAELKRRMTEGSLQSRESARREYIRKYMV